MFDIAPSEFLLVAFVALIVIGPKDLPKAMRVVGHWVGKARGVARQFRQGFDTMVREAELDEMEKKWAAENERIMREHPSPPTSGEAASAGPGVSGAVSGGDPQFTDEAVPVEGLIPGGDMPGDGHVSGGNGVSGDDGAGDHPAPVMVERPVVAAAPADSATPRSDGAPS